MANDQTTGPLNASLNYRAVEKLVALYRFEMDGGNGSGPCEGLEEILRWVQDVILNPTSVLDDGYTDDEMDGIHRRALAMGEAIVRALIVMGESAEVERYLDAVALRRAQCEARFKMDRPTPFTEAEQQALAAGWDAVKSDVDAANATSDDCEAP